MWAYPLRAIGPSLGEREGFQDTSDLGGAFHLHWKTHSLVLSLQNGEGRRYSEQNRGKDFFGGVNLTLYQNQNHHIQGHIAYRDGSRGPSAGRNHRLFSALWWKSRSLHLGAIGYGAWGLNQRPSLEAHGLQTWASWWAIPNALNLFIAWEGYRYQLYTSANQVANMPIPTQMMSVQNQSKGARYQAGLSHQLARISDPTHSMHYQINLFERIEYQVPTNLNSPVFGIPSLAEQWRLSINVAFSWGPQPFNEYTASPIFASPEPLL